MRIGSCSTTDSFKCISCNKTTCTYDVAQHAGLALHVPVCTECSGKINLNKHVANKLVEIRREILMREVAK